MYQQEYEVKRESLETNTQSEFANLYNKLSYQNNILLEYIAQLYSISNKLKNRGPSCKDKESKETSSTDDVVGSLYQEAIRLEYSNNSLLEIIDHLKSVI